MKPCCGKKAEHQTWSFHPSWTVSVKFGLTYLPLAHYECSSTCVIHLFEADSPLTCAGGSTRAFEMHSHVTDACRLTVRISNKFGWRCRDAVLQHSCCEHLQTAEQTLYEGQVGSLCTGLNLQIDLKMRFNSWWSVTGTMIYKKYIVLCLEEQMKNKMQMLHF